MRKPKIMETVTCIGLIYHLLVLIFKSQILIWFDFFEVDINYFNLSYSKQS